MKLRKDRLYQRQEEAIKRNEAWKALSVDEKLAQLDKYQFRAEKQRIKLEASRV